MNATAAASCRIVGTRRRGEVAFRAMPRPSVNFRFAALAACAALFSLLPGCNSMNGPEVITLTARDYPMVFEACLDQARDAGMPAVLSDRSIGIIETKPRHIGSFMEPWRLDSSGLGQTAAATIQFERRRVRFEFTPVGFTLPPPRVEGALTGASVPGGVPAESRFDLEHYEGAIELRTWVYVERGFTPGLKPGVWSLSLTTTWTDTVTNVPTNGGRDDTTTRSPTQWTPIARDEAMERTLMERVQEQMLRGESAKPDSTATPATTATAATTSTTATTPPIVPAEGGAVGQ